MKRSFLGKRNNLKKCDMKSAKLEKTLHYLEIQESLGSENFAEYYYYHATSVLYSFLGYLVLSRKRSYLLKTLIIKVFGFVRVSLVKKPGNEAKTKSYICNRAL